MKRKVKQCVPNNKHKICPYCGKTKRSWRTLYEEILCAECDKLVENGAKNEDR
jgi:transcription initiation factor TFIIIB Brf1 subunit/transcription initiation factor TFIIB